jgi:hypothetical protein
LAETLPGATINVAAATLNNVGLLDSEQNRMKEARKAYKEALATYRKLTNAVVSAQLLDRW